MRPDTDFIAERPHFHGATVFRRTRLIRRLLQLIQIGQSRRYVTLEELAKECAVSTRTIRRDLEAMADVGCELPKFRLPEWEGADAAPAASVPRRVIKQAVAKGREAQATD